MKRYGFTGTRTGLTEYQKNEIIKILQKDLSENIEIEVHHGDCVGSDTDFHNICFQLSQNIKIIIHPPIDNKLRSFCKSNNINSPKDYLDRNRDIVNESDLLIACPVSKNEELRSGTWYTIRYAKKINKPLTNYNINSLFSPFEFLYCILLLFIVILLNPLYPSV